MNETEQPFRSFREAEKFTAENISVLAREFLDASEAGSYAPTGKFVELVNICNKVSKTSAVTVAETMVVRLAIETIAKQEPK